MSLPLLLPSTASAQTVDKGKVEVEAAGQAAEADRLFKRGEWAQALAIYDAERTSRAALGDVRYEAYALRAIGLCHANLGDDESAIEAYAGAHALDLKREDKGYAGYDLFLTAQAEDRLARPLDALKTLERGFPLLSQGVDRDHETDARLVMTRTLLNLGRADEARPHIARALALAEELKDDLRIADAWSWSGQVEGSLGNLSTALERFADAAELFEQQGRAADAAWMETATASTLARLGRPDLALARFESAAEMHEHLEDFGSMSEDLAAVAGLLVEANRLDDALLSAKKAVDKAMEVDDRPREVEARVRLSQVQGRKGDWPGASATLDEAVTLIRQVARDDPGEQIRLLLAAALTDHKAKLDDRAGQRLDAARKIADESGSVELRRAVVEVRSQIEANEPTPGAPRPQP